MKKKWILKFGMFGAAVGVAVRSFAEEKSGLSWMLPEGITSFSEKVDTLFYTLIYSSRSRGNKPLFFERLLSDK